MQGTRWYHEIYAKADMIFVKTFTQPALWGEKKLIKKCVNHNAICVNSVDTAFTFFCDKIAKQYTLFSENLGSY